MQLLHTINIKYGLTAVLIDFFFFYDPGAATTCFLPVQWFIILFYYFAIALGSPEWVNDFITEVEVFFQGEFVISRIYIMCITHVQVV